MKKKEREALAVALRCAADVMNSPTQASQAMTITYNALSPSPWGNRLWDAMVDAVAKIVGDREAAFDFDASARQLAFLRAAAEVEAATP